jgi:predicted HAD superfamily Cof-like phosphohydrolase
MSALASVTAWKSGKKKIKEKLMTNPFRDQEKFMRACDQSVDKFDQDQYNMYKNLIDEEFNELQEALDMEAELDALIDILVVTIGAIHSAGFDAEGAWKEVMMTNFAKIDRDTGKVRKREDGKVLKPTGWTPPNLTPFLKKE